MVWMVEGEWSGYTSNQRRVAHRHYTARRQEAESISDLGFIQFTDGTALFLNVKQLAARRKLPEVKTYKALIEDCLLHKVNSVQALVDLRKPAAG